MRLEKIEDYSAILLFIREGMVHRDVMIKGVCVVLHERLMLCRCMDKLFSASIFGCKEVWQAVIDSKD